MLQGGINGWVPHKRAENKLYGANDSYPQNDSESNDCKRTDPHVKLIDCREVMMCNSKGFSRLARHCDDKSLNILLNPALFSENSEKHHYASTSNEFVEHTLLQKCQTETNGGLYNFQGKTMTEVRKCSYGFPDTLFLTQIFNQEKYDTIPDNKKCEQIFSARGMFTTSLYTKKQPSDNFSYWTFCRCCETTFDFSTHSPGDYKHILIDSNLLCIIAFDTTLLPHFQLSFRRLQGGYSRQFTSHVIKPFSHNDNDHNNNDTIDIDGRELNNSNVSITELGILLDNRDVFGSETKQSGVTPAKTSADACVSPAGLSGLVFDCLLMDIEHCNNTSANNNNNIIVNLLLICKALPHVQHCFEFIKLKVVFSDGYENLLSCWCQRDTNVAINYHLNMKKMLDSKSESLFGWNNKTTRFKAECVKIEPNNMCNSGSKYSDQTSVIKHNRLLIMVINTTSHHIILYNFDSNNYAILKLNSSTSINSNKMFPYVCYYYLPCLCFNFIFSF